MKIAGVVVTYNRKEELLKNIKAILSQSLIVDKYYIIDNHGTDNTKEYLKAHGVLDNNTVEYVFLSENIGGAGGFYTGTKMAYEEGFEYICLMDDDGRPADNLMMENLIRAAEKLRKVNNMLFLNSLVYGFDTDILSFGLKGGIKTYNDAINNANNGLILGTVNPFNGTLISRQLIENIGFPNKDFFIKGDEQDYYSRAMKAGAYVATVTSSRYNHPILTKKYVSFLGKKFNASTEAPWKEYYRARNYTYMFKRDGVHKKWIRQNIKQIIWGIMYNREKFQCVKMILKGCYDGLKGNLGANIRP